MFTNSNFDPNFGQSHSLKTPTPSNPYIIPNRTNPDTVGTPLEPAQTSQHRDDNPNIPSENHSGQYSAPYSAHLPLQKNINDNDFVLSQPIAKLDLRLHNIFRLPRHNSDYISMLRTPNFRWWRPLLSLLTLILVHLALAFGSIFLVAFSIFFTEGATTGFDNFSYLFSFRPASENQGLLIIAILLFTLVLLIPSVLVAFQVGHARSAAVASSVEIRIRWKWLFTCLGIFIPVMLAGILASVYISTGELFEIKITPHTLIGIVVVFLLVPLQSAAEEFLFRGWFMQNFGAYFKHSRSAWIVVSPISVLLFVLAHGSSSLNTNLFLGSMAVVATLLVWKTGGIEASIAIHAANNILVFTINLLVAGSLDANSAQNSDLPIVSLLCLETTLVVVYLITQTKFKKAENAGTMSHKFTPIRIPDEVAQNYYHPQPKYSESSYGFTPSTNS